MVARQTIPFSAFVIGFLRLIRVQNLLIVVLTQFLARIFLVGPKAEWPLILVDPTIWLLSLSTVCIAAAGYIINDYFDIKIDLINKPQRVVIGRYLKRRVAMGTHQLLNVIGCLIGLYLSKWVFVADVVSVSLLWFYSAQFKRQPVIGNVVISLLTALSLIVLAVYYRQNADMLLIYALFSFGISLVREIIKDMQDVRGDARFGCRTLPIVWGLRRTKYLLYVLIALFIMSMFLIADALGNPRLGWIFLILLIPITWLTYRLVYADTRRDFGYLSTLCKLIMLMGVLSMIWA
ncbi:geranylgeranylglycerol-phosphate geranylgeranyltransferase [Spirosoma taeanense]|uniref:Geranylgeranylglycerol-phosphate geranylgeranyltransferase n=1 Tax=Spirosoma taeanense TaxID=2735870 RepID=A0A6M5YGL7_9BACT|nr:geranylgeranylglycerol-phosphate geranylgeranyltransferase [Spirosoma taeanense]QJW92393.1 geranylgeranylglycerol-phosphate geranylgeranyltransferase [Spirosoma taeanense]